MCLTGFVAAAGVRATNEVQILGRECPADIFLDRWMNADPVAVDVTHPLAPSLELSVRQAKEAAASKERQKVAVHLLREKQLNFILVGVATSAVLGPQAIQFVDDAVDFCSAACAVGRGVCAENSSWSACKWRFCKKWASGSWPQYRQERRGTERIGKRAPRRTVKDVGFFPFICCYFAIYCLCVFCRVGSGWCHRPH